MSKSNKKSKEIYLDYASATPLDYAVSSVMQKVLKENFANPGSIHEFGVKSKKILEENRTIVAKILGAHNDEIIFTSGATESNNLAIVGAVKKNTELFFENHTYLPAGKLLCSARQPAQCFSKNTQQIFSQIPHIITTNIEHPSVLETCRYLESVKQAEVTYVPVEANGIVDPKKIKKAIKQNTILISVMYANNEIGTVQPIIEIAKEIRHYRKTKNQESLDPTFRHPISKGRVGEGCIPLFHTDATQAINYLLIKVEKLGVDLMSFNGGKIYGPKGTGVLYVKRKTLINKIMHGGNQEFGLRPGTENVGIMAGLTEALKITEKIKEKETKRLIKLRDYFIEKLFELQKKQQNFSSCALPGVPVGTLGQNNFAVSFFVNGDLKNRLPNNINITIPKIPSDLLVLELSARGIYVSEKSACKSGEKAGSYVINALNQMPNKACKKPDGSLRFSLGRQTTKTDIDYTLKSLVEILEKLKRWYN